MKEHFTNQQKYKSHYGSNPILSLLIIGEYNNIEMRRISKSRSLTIRNFLVNLFVTTPSNPIPLEMIILLSEIVIYIYFVCSSSKRKQDVAFLFGYGMQYLYLFILIGTIIFRTLLGIVLSRLWYILILLLLFTFNWQIWFGILMIFLLGIVISIDVLSHIQISFSTQNPYSQIHNYTKFLHYSVVIISIFIQFRSQSIWGSNLNFLSSIINITLFSVLFITKIFSKTSKNLFKSITLRFYLACIGYFLRNLALVWLGGKLESVYEHIIVIGATQIIYTLGQLKYGQIQLQNQISNNQIVNIVFLILCYVYSEDSDKNMSGIMEKFVKEHRNSKSRIIYLQKKDRVDNIDGHGQINGLKQTVQSKIANIRNSQILLNNKNSQKGQNIDRLQNTNSFMKSNMSLNPDMKDIFRSSNNQNFLNHFIDSGDSLMENGNRLCFRNLRRHEVKLSINQYFNIGSQNKFDVAERVEELLYQSLQSKIDDQFTIMYLLAEIKYTINRDMIGSLTILQKIKTRFAGRNPIQKILLQKLKQKIITQSLAKQNLNKVQFFNDFFQNEHLRNIIIKNSYKYLELWREISTDQLLFSKIDKKLYKIIKQNKQIGKEYRQLERKCKNLVSLYINYMYMVRRDVSLVITMKRQSQILKYQEYFMNVDRKIYISLSIALGELQVGKFVQKKQINDQNVGSFFIINNVSYNVKKLLGYDKSSLKNANISVFLPQFFIKYHQILLTEAFQLKDGGMYVFKKIVMIKHADSYYIPAQLQLKLYYNNSQQQFLMQGYIQILENQNYNWLNYVFVKQSNEQIIQIGPNLKPIIDLNPLKSLHFSDYFESEKMSSNSLSEQSRRRIEYKDGNNRNRKEYSIIKYLYHNGMEYEYQLVKVFKYEQIEYLYYVCKNYHHNTNGNVHGNTNDNFQGNSNSNGNIANITVHDNANINAKDQDQIKQHEIFHKTNNYQNLHQQQQNPLVNNNIKTKYKKQQKVNLSKFEDYLEQFLQYRKFQVKFQDFQTNLEEYFEKKVKVIQLINSYTPKLFFALILIIVLAVSALLIFQFVRLNVLESDSQLIKLDFDHLLDYYHQLNNVGVMVNQYQLNYYNNLSLVYNYYNMTTLCLSLQQKNQILYKFNVNQPESELRTFKQLVIELISNIYLTIYLQTSTIYKISYEKIDSLIKNIWSSKFNSYITQYLTTVRQGFLSNKNLKLVMLIIVFFLVVVIYVIILKMDSFLRENEYESLNLLSSLNATPLFITSIQQFLRKAIGSINDNDFIDKELKIKDTRKDTYIGNMNINSSVNSPRSSFSARQNSVRNLFQEQGMISSNRDHLKYFNTNSFPLNTLEIREKVDQDQMERKQKKIRRRSKIFVLLWSLFLLAFISISVSELVIDSTGSTIRLSSFIENLLIIFNKNIGFSSTVITYLSTISTNNIYNASRSSQKNLKLLNFKENFDQFLKFKSIQEKIQQLGLGQVQFKEFTGLYQKVNYGYLCEYIECDPKYKDSINIIYNSAVYKLNQFMIENAQVNLTDSSPIVFDLQLLLYSHYILEDTYHKLLKLSITNYNKYQLKKKQNQIIFWSFEITTFVSYAAFAILYYWYFFRKQRQHAIDVINLVKSESYQLKMKQSQLK